MRRPRYGYYEYRTPPPFAQAATATLGLLTSGAHATQHPGGRYLPA